MKRKLALTMTLFGCALIVAAFIVRPSGEIHPSVMGAYATTLTYAAGLFGFDFKTRKNAD